MLSDWDIGVKIINEICMGVWVEEDYMKLGFVFILYFYWWNILFMIFSWGLDIYGRK